MQFFVPTRICRHPDEAISLRDVWAIGDEELSHAAVGAWEHLHEERELANLHCEVAWSAQALIEFADLANFTRSGKGRFQYKNYLYFEAVYAMREATVGILNGSPRASIGLLRSVLEMVVLHCWWQKRILRKGNSRQFYDWLEGRKPKPRFGDVIENNFKWLDMLPDDAAKKHAQHTYKQLCSYVHAPIHKESIMMLNQGNVGQGIGVLRHWFILARDTLRIGLEQLVHLYPQCLFPVDITRKFGTNPPVGMYFDEFNFVPLRAVFGKAQIKSYKTRLQHHEFVKSVIDFYESQEDLTTEEILEARDNMNNSDGASRDSDDPVVLWLHAKAQMRVSALAMTYSEPLGPHW